MLRHYVKTAFRNLMKKKMYTAINVFGLASGLAMCLIVLGHVSYELSFEDIHEKRDNIYRVEGAFAFEDDQYDLARVNRSLGLSVVDELPEAETAAIFQVKYIRSLQVGEKRYRIVDENKGAGYTHHNKLIFADTNYFDVFSIPLVQGDPSTALAEPFSLLVSESAVRQYFEGEDPVGQSVEVNDTILCKITGILRDIPQNTQIHCQFMISYSTLTSLGAPEDNWDKMNEDYVYLLVNQNADIGSLDDKISAIAKRQMSTAEGDKFTFKTKPLKGIYFTSLGYNIRGSLSPMGEISMIQAMAIVALFVLIIAIANFINLSTARASDRMKEVGVRKVFGAQRSHLTRQYIGESLVITFISMIIGVMVYEGFKVYFGDIFPRDWMVDFYNSSIMLFGVIVLILFVGIAAGLYPAIYLSRFKPITIFQGKPGGKSSRSILRKSLVVFQFCVAAVFIFCSIVTNDQHQFLTSMDLGFDSENMLIFDFDGDKAQENLQLVKTEILNSVPVLAATVTNVPPGRKEWTTYGYYPNEERLREEMLEAKGFKTDEDFIPTFGLQPIEGRNFSSGMVAGDVSPIIINEAMVKLIGTNNPIGHIIYSGGEKSYEVIGVVSDFHGAPLNFIYRAEVVIMYDPENCNSLALKLPADQIPIMLSSIQNIWERSLPGYGFDYSFLDDEIMAVQSESKGQVKMFRILSSFAVAIACLGIFGLVSYTARQRTREIGVRKVLGSSVAQIVTLLSKEFVVLIVVANAIALPIGYLMMQDMMSWDPFQVTIGPGTYLLVISIAVLFGLCSAGFQAVKAATANPVEALRNE